jgi:CheY-like chemotaxis protein
MDAEQKRILYVDDDTDTCLMMKAWLGSGSNSYNITAVTSAEEASKLIAGQHFDLYVLDYCLPAMSGPELCRLIRKSDTTTPVVVYSALTRPVDREKAMDSGASLYLVKPDEIDTLRSTIRRLLGSGTYISQQPSARHGRRARGIV